MPSDFAPLIVRLLALVLALVHLGALVGNVAQSLDRLDPAYLGHFARQQLLRPAVGLALAALLVACERPLSAWLATSP